MSKLLQQQYPRFSRSYTEFIASLGDVSLPSIGTHIEPKLRQLADAYDTEVVTLQLLIVGEPTPSWCQHLANYFCLDPAQTAIDFRKAIDTTWNGLPFRLQFVSLIQASVRPVGVYPGHLAFIAFVDTTDATAENLAVVQLWARRFAWVCVLHDQPTTLPIWPNADRFLSVSYSTYKADSPRFWETPLFASQVAIVHTYNSLLTIDSIHEALNQLTGQAERATRLNKLLNQAGSGSARGGVESDPFSTLKAFMQQKLPQFEKDALDQLDAYFMPGTGRYWTDINPTIDSLTELETVQRAKTNLLRIDQNAINLFMKHVRRVIQRNLTQAFEPIRKGFETLEKELNDLATSKKLPPVSLFFTHLTENQLQPILDSAVRIDRAYEASINRKGFYEYAMAVRRYQMMFFMFASTFGVAATIRTHLEVMIPLSLALMSYGIYSIRKTVMQERAEVQERELEKAHDTLREESRRISGEVQSRWRRQLSEYFKGQQTGLLRQLDDIAVAYQQQRVAEADDEQRRLRRVTQRYESLEKQLYTLTQALRNWQRNQQTIKNELRSAYLALR
ncbi:hypothetical protein [Spirosoma panaciterrae]|uniref:hypothetical protein n=1 Tax=Spirosoma panaciterrae TaxID=496058 RepID=UPI000369CB0A|nr:hypothetical protein [Spirosoma panaciterrae]